MNDGARTADAEPATPSGPGTTSDSEQSDRVVKAARHGRFRRRRRNRLLQGGVLLGVLALWWLITAIQLIDPLYLPSPQSVFGAFIDANRCLVVDETSGLEAQSQGVSRTNGIAPACVAQRYSAVEYHL